MPKKKSKNKNVEEEKILEQQQTQVETENFANDPPVTQNEDIEYLEKECEIIAVAELSLASASLVFAPLAHVSQPVEQNTKDASDVKKCETEVAQVKLDCAPLLQPEQNEKDASEVCVSEDNSVDNSMHTPDTQIHIRVEKNVENVGAVCVDDSKSEANDGQHSHTQLHMLTDVFLPSISSTLAACFAGITKPSIDQLESHMAEIW